VCGAQRILAEALAREDRRLWRREEWRLWRGEDGPDAVEVRVLLLPSARVRGQSHAAHAHGLPNTRCARRYPPANRAFALIFQTPAGSEQEERQGSRPWRAPDWGDLQTVSLSLCAVVIFAGPVAWALFYSIDDPGVSAAEAGCAKCPGPERNITQGYSSDGNPWEELGHTRTAVIFVSCGVWVTCLWLHTRRLQLMIAESTARRPEIAITPPHKVAQSLQTIVDMTLPPSDDDSQGSTRALTALTEEGDSLSSLAGSETSGGSKSGERGNEGNGASRAQEARADAGGGGVFPSHVQLLVRENRVDEVDALSGPAEDLEAGVPTLRRVSLEARSFKTVSLGEAPAEGAVSEEKEHEQRGIPQDAVEKRKSISEEMYGLLQLLQQLSSVSPSGVEGQVQVQEMNGDVELSGSEGHIARQIEGADSWGRNSAAGAQNRPADAEEDADDARPMTQQAAFLRAQIEERSPARYQSPTSAEATGIAAVDAGGMHEGRGRTQSERNRSHIGEDRDEKEATRNERASPEGCPGVLAEPTEEEAEELVSLRLADLRALEETWSPKGVAPADVGQKNSTS